MKNIPLLIGTIVGTIALVVGIAFFFSGTNQQNGLAAPADEATVLGEARHATGSAEAKVTIVEFSDFQCPACQAIQPLVKQVTAQYPDDVRLVYRHFPISSIHPYAQIAAQASEVAAEEGKFWEMHDLLFARQSAWEGLESEDAVRVTLTEYAGELGIDSAKFSERIGSEEIRQRVLEDLADVSALGLNSTPSLFVNNQKISAPQQLLPAVESLVTNQE